MDENNTVHILSCSKKKKIRENFVPKINKQFKYIALIVLDTSVNFYHGLFYNIPANTKNINLNKLSEIKYVNLTVEKNILSCFHHRVQGYTLTFSLFII